MFSNSLKSYELNDSTPSAKKDFENDGSTRVLLAVRCRVKTKFLDAPMESLSIFLSNSSECRYCAGWRAEHMSWSLALRRTSAREHVYSFFGDHPGTLF